jgi:hypothetical protein
MRRTLLLMLLTPVLLYFAGVADLRRTDSGGWCLHLGQPGPLHVMVCHNGATDHATTSTADSAPAENPTAPR